MIGRFGSGFVLLSRTIPLTPTFLALIIISPLGWVGISRQLWVKVGSVSSSVVRVAVAIRPSTAIFLLRGIWIEVGVSFA